MAFLFFGNFLRSPFFIRHLDPFPLSTWKKLNAAKQREYYENCFTIVENILVHNRRELASQLYRTRFTITYNWLHNH